MTALSCTRCGAPASPADQAAVQCRYCGEWVAIAEDIRARLRAVLVRDTSRRASEQLVAKLVRQPGALRTAFVIAVAALPSMFVWPVILVIAAGLYALAFLRLSNSVLLVTAALASIAAFFFLVRGQLSDRQALRLLTLHFSARAPAQPGAPHGCRVCSAPLVEPPGAALVACLFCGAENVLGLDAGREAKTQTDERMSLEDALNARRAEHRRWRFSAVLAVGMLALSVVLVLAGLGPPHDLVVRGHARDLERVTYDPYNEFCPTPSPTGTTVVYDLRVPDEEGEDTLMSCGPEGAFRGSEFTPAAAQARRPVWLPDGSGVLYVSEPPGRGATLRRTLSPQPFAATQVVATAGHDIGVPSVSPDGKRVAYAGADTHAGGSYIYVVSIEGGKPKRLGAGINPAWSPDGTEIVYSRTIGRYRQLRSIDPGGSSKPAQLTGDACNHEDPVWSPDGALLLYLADCGHASKSAKIWNVYVMHRDGKTAEQLTDGDTYVETPAWVGDQIYLSANVAGNFDIWRLHLTGDLAGHGRRVAPHRS